MTLTVSEISRQIKDLPNDRVLQKTLDLVKQSNLTDEEKCQIIEEVALKDLTGTANRFREFKITSEKCRYKSAKIVANLSGRLITIQIQNFELNEKHVSKIAAQALSQDPVGTLTHFENFGLDEHSSYKVITESKTLKASLVAQYFSQLGIRDQERVFLLAVTIFSKDPRGCAKHIGAFNIQVENRRFGLLIARLRADGDKALSLLESFGVQSPEYKLKAAFIVAKQDGWKFSAEIDKWGIANESDRFKLFEAAFDQHPLGAVTFITHYHLSSDSLVAAFNLAIKSKVSPLGDALLNSGLNQVQINLLLQRYAKENPAKLLAEIESWNCDAETKNSIREIANQARAV